MTRFRALCVFFLSLVPVLASAATMDFRVLIDADNDVASGCTVSGMPGVDQVLTTRLNTTESAASVTGTSRQVCTGGALGASVAVETTGWPAGYQPESGNLLVETRFPLSIFGGTAPMMRIGIEAANGAAVHTAIVRPDGSLVTYPAPPAGKRRSVGTPGSGAARVITLDGQGQDWNGLNALFDGIASGGTPALRITRVFAFTDVPRSFIFFNFHANIAANLPFAADDNYTRNAGSGLTVSAPGVLANDTDPNGQPLTAMPLSLTTRGTVVLHPDGSFTYTPDDPSSTASDAFEYKATNGTKDSNAARVRITVADAPPGGIPQAGDDAYNANEDELLTVPAPGVLQNDSDPDGDAITAALLQAPSHGTVVLNANGGFTYTPAPEYIGTDTFTYSVSDGSNTDTAVVTITITSTNDQPSVTAATFSVPENSAAGTAVGTVQVVDGDAADTHTWSIRSGNVNNAFEIDPATGEITVNGALDFEGGPSQYLLTVRATDSGVPSQYGESVITINVTNANDAPVAASQTVATNEDTPVAITLSATDADGGTPTYPTVGTPANGTLSGTAPNLTYTPNPNFSGTDSFTFRADDGSTQSNLATVTINVNAVNDAPINNALLSPMATDEDTTLSLSSLLGFSDVDGTTARVTLSATNGTVTLGGTAGLTFITGDGSGDATMTFEGTVAALNAAMNGSTYTPAANFNGPETLSMVTNDLGNTGAGGPLTDSDALSITVNAVNDAPVNTVPGAQSTAEDASFALTGVSVSDSDAGASSIRVALNATSGSLTMTTLTGLSFSTGDGSADSSMTFDGTIANVNAALATLSYTPNADYTGPATFTITTDDLGNTGGAAQTDSDTVAITVLASNDAPVNTVPGAQTTNEDTPLGITGISVADADAGAGALNVTLSVTDGTLSLASTTGLTFTTGDGSGDASMAFSGTSADLNAALATVTFAPAADFNGSSTLTLVTSDNGNTGVGGAQSDTDTVSIAVNAVNDAPVNTLPASDSTNEDTAGSFTASVDDVDDNGGSLTVTLTASTGTMSLATTAGLSFTTGDGANDASMTFSGTEAAIDAALAAVGYVPPANFHGVAGITLVTNDNGNTGGGALSDTDSFNFTVVSVNDAPVNVVPGPQTVNEDAMLNFGAGVQVSDVEATTMQVTLEVSNGTLTLSGTSGLSFNAGDGTADSTIIFAGSVADLNAAMNGLVYTPNINYNGSDSLQVWSVDLGQSGAGGLLSDIDNVAIAVNAVNDAPINVMPAAQTTTEDVPLTLTGANAIQIADVDAAANDIRATLNVANGTVTLSGVAGLTFITGDGTDDATLVFEGTLAEINAALNGMTFTGTQHYSGPAQISITTSDLGHSGSGGALTDTDALSITITAANDAPVLTVPAAQLVNEDGTLNFGAGISVADADAGAGNLEATLSVTSGTLTLGSTAGLAFTTGDGTADAAMTFTGTLAAINTALNGLTYSPAADSTSSDLLSISVNDLGNTGGAAATDSDTVTINVTAVNDAPAVSVPASASTNEDTPLAISSVSFADIDAASGSVTVTVNVNNGTLTLASLTGLSFGAGDGTNDATIAFSGTVAATNAALNGITFTPAANVSGTATFAITVNDNGNTGTGGAGSDTDSFNITINPVNDAPLNTVPATQTTPEDTTVAISGLSVADLDVGAGSVQVTLSVTNGTLTLGTTTGLAFTTGDGAADASMTFTGSLADVNAALATLGFAPAADFTGTATVTIATDDLGNTPAPNASDSDNFNITVTAVNDAPVLSLPIGQTTNEDAPLTFNAANTNLIAFSDVDAGSAAVKVTLSVTQGTFSLSGTTGLTFTTGDGSGDTNAVFTGSAAAANAALDGLIYTPNANYNGLDTLSISVDDQGNSGSGGAGNDAGSVVITVNEVNDAPVNSVPAAQTIDEDSTLTLSGANAIQVSDLDAAPSPLTVSISGVNGTLTLSGTTGLTFTTGDGTADPALEFSGSIADINAALNGLVFTPSADFTGSASIDIVTQDNGATGGGNLTDSDSVAITVSGVNDNPVNTVPAGLSGDEDTAITFGGTVTIADLDAGTSSVQMTLTVTQGTLSFTGATTGLTFTTGDGTADVTMTFTGAITDINTALGGISYSPNADYNGSDSITVTTSDLGNTGPGGAKTDSDAIPVTVNAVNDAPVNTTPGAQTINEDASLTFSTANGNAISTSDIDAGTNSVQLTLGATNGTLTLGALTGLTFTTGDGTADTDIVATGSLTDVNAALQGLVYTPSANANGAQSVTITIDDQGNSGSGGAKSDTDVVTVNVTAVNDAPQISGPGAQTIAEDTPTGFAFSASDAEATTLQITVSTTSGFATLASTTNLTFTTGDGTADTSMVFSGLTADVNAAIASISFTTNGNYNGSAQLSVAVSDLGVAGTGGTLTDTAISAITITAVNDDPINNLPAAQTTAEDTPLTISVAATNALSVTDPDANTDDIQTTLNVSNGTVSLATITGLLLSGGDGTDDITVTLKGTVDEINAALDGLVFKPTANYSGPAAIQVVTDDLGANGSGGQKTDTDSLTITVTAVDDSPTVAASGLTTLTFTEGDAATTVDATIDLNDGDSANLTGATVQITANYQNGADVLAAATLAGGLTQNWVAATGTLEINGTASVADFETTLRSITFVNGSNAPSTAARTVTWTINDGNSTGSTTSSIGVVAVNDDPVNTVPAVPGNVNEDDTVTFTGGTAIAVSDSDAGSAKVAIELSSTNGVMTLDGTTGLDFTSGTGTAEASMKFEGKLGDVNAALDGMTFQPTLEFAGTASVTITINDQGNTGTGGAKSDTDTYNITVNPVNDAPVNTVPGAQSTAEDTAKVFSTGNSNLISIADGDAGANPVQVTLTGTNGTVTLSGTTGLSFTTGDGTADPTMTFTGTVTAINTALNGLSWTPTLNYTGAAGQISIVTNDQGFTGGGAQSDTDSVTITVTAVNDAPVITVPGAQSTAEDTPFPFNGSISVADVDAGTDSIKLELIATNGTLTLNGTTGLTFTTGDGTGDASMVFTGAITAINTALNGLTYTPNSEYSGSALITVNADDQSFNGAGGAQTDSDSITLTITPVNDKPANSVPGAQTFDEDTSRVFNAANSNLISVSDPDAGTNNVHVTLTVTNGVLTLGSLANVTFPVGDGTSDVTMTIQGTIADINNALNGLTYTPNLNYNGTETLTVITNDLGNTGGGAQQDTDPITLNVSAVNDAPVVNAPAADTFNEDNNRIFSSGNGNQISITDVDATSLEVTLSTSASHGTISLAATAGLAFGAGDGTDDVTMTFTGSPLNVATALSAVTYKPALNYYGAADLDIAVDDNGTTGSGPVGSDTHQIDLTINPVNDPPVAGTDTFATIGNTELRIDLTAGTTPNVNDTTASTRGVSDNDSDPVESNPFVVTSVVGCGDTTAPFDCTVSGQHILLEADGKLSYTPAPGTTSGTFQYVITDNPSGVGSPASATGTVNITINDMVWYVNGGAAAGGNGTSKAPYNTFAPLNGAGGAGDVDDDADYIFVHNSTVTTGIELESNQRLWGEGYGLSLNHALNGNGAPVVLVAAGTKPSISVTGAGVDAVKATAALPAEVRGLNISSANSNAIDITTAAAFSGASTLLIDGIGFTGAGAETVDINFNAGTTGSRVISVQNGTWSGTHASNGIDALLNNVNTTPYLDLGNNNITVSGTGINASRSGANGTLNIRGLSGNTISGTTGGSGILINTATFDGSEITGGLQSVAGGVTSIGVDNPIGASGMLLTTVQGTLAFTQFNIVAGNGTGLGVTGTGSMTVTTGGSTSTISATNGPAADLNNVAVTMDLGAVVSTGSSTTGVNLTNVTGTFNGNSSSSIVTLALPTTVVGFNISGGSADVDWNGPITSDQGSLVTIVNSTGGTKRFDGALSDSPTANAGRGITLTGNNGTTINFNGGLTLNTGANAAFTATGTGPFPTINGGTVTVSNAVTNTITTTTGNGVTIENTAIGTGGVTFRSVTAGTGGAGPAHGIKLSNTGSTAGFAIAGTGSAGTGGTIQKATTGILLANTRDISLSWMNVNTSSDDGINGSNVTNFTMANSTLTNNGDGPLDEGIEFDNLLGNAALTNLTMSGSRHNHVYVDNTSGTLNLLTISGGSYNNNSAADGNNGIEVDARTTALISGVTVTGVTVSGNKATGVFFTAADTATFNNANIQSSTFTNNNIAIDINKSQSSNMMFRIQNNTTITGQNSHAINIFTAANDPVAGPFNAGSMQGRIENNVIGNAAVSKSGSAIGNCLRMVHQGATTTGAYVVHNNVMRQCYLDASTGGRAMDVLVRAGTGGAHLTLTSNTIMNDDPANPTNGSSIALQALNTTATASYANKLYADIRNNTFESTPSWDLVDGQMMLSATQSAQLFVKDNAPVNGGTNDAAAAKAEVQGGGNTGSVETNEFTSGQVRLTTVPINQPPV